MIETVKLGEKIEFQRGYDLTHDNMRPGPYPVVGSTSIIGYHDDYKAENGITLGRSGTVGIPQLVNGKYWPHNTSLFTTNLKGNIREYLFYLLVNLHIDRMKTGSNIPTLNRNDIYPLEVPFETDVSEQKKIANVLSTLDEKIKNNNDVASLLENLAKLLYDYWFVQFDFPDENGRPYKSSGGKMVWNEKLKREIPEGWESGCFRDVLDIGNGRDHKNLDDGNIPVYGSGGLMRRVNTSLYTGESVLIPRKGTLNNIMYVNEAFWTVDTMFYTKMKRRNIAKYMYYATKVYDFEKLNTGTGVPSMTTDIIYKLNVLIPTSFVLEHFDAVVTPIYTAMKQYSEENQQLASLRDFLLPMLMNGQVKVADKTSEE